MQINWSNIATGLGLMLIIGTEIGMMAFATVWALSGLLGLPHIVTTVFYGMAVLAALAGIGAALRLIHRTEPFFGPTGSDR